MLAHASDAPVIEGEQVGPPPNFTDFERDLHAQVAAGLEAAPPVRVDRTVLDGDVILGVFNLDRSEAAASFRRLAALDVDVACFGHGEPVLNDASTRLREVANTVTP